MFRIGNAIVLRTADKSNKQPVILNYLFLSFEVLVKKKEKASVSTWNSKNVISLFFPLHWLYPFSCGLGQGQCKHWKCSAAGEGLAVSFLQDSKFTSMAVRWELCVGGPSFGGVSPVLQAQPRGGISNGKFKREFLGCFWTGNNVLIQVWEC